MSPSITEKFLTITILKFKIGVSEGKEQTGENIELSNNYNFVDVAECESCEVSRIFKYSPKGKSKDFQ